MSTLEVSRTEGIVNQLLFHIAVLLKVHNILATLVHHKTEHFLINHEKLFLIINTENIYTKSKI